MLDLGRTFLQSVDRSANTTALVDGSVRLTWGEWARAIGGVQRGLAALGLRHGDHVLSVLQNRYEAATLHWACQFSGLVMTPLNWRAKPEEIDYVLRDSEARLLVFEAASEESLESSVLGKTVTRMAVGTVRSEAPRFDDLLKERRDPTPLARAEDLSLMLYTSGTTGAPKGVPRRQRTERVAALAHVAQNRYLTVALLATGMSFWWALVLTPLLMAVLGFVTERGLIQRVFHSKDRHTLTLLLTFGVAVVLEDALKIAFGANPLRLEAPISGATEMLGLFFPNYRLFVMLFGGGAHRWGMAAGLSHLAGGHRSSGRI